MNTDKPQTNSSTHKIIKTSDGKIAFRRGDFRQMAFTDRGLLENRWSITLWTDTTPGGRIIYFNTLSDRDRAAQEISKQL